ncbi:hypothetical protein ACJW31_07G077700 [Castanea mollissima]
MTLSTRYICQTTIFLLQTLYHLLSFLVQTPQVNMLEEMNYYREKKKTLILDDKSMQVMPFWVHQLEKPSFKQITKLDYTC